MKKNISSLVTVSLLLTFSLVLSVSGFGQEYEFVLKWGSMGTGDGQFHYPFDIAVSSENFVYVTDEWNNRVQMFNSNGNYLLEWGSKGWEDGEFYSPTGIDVDSSDNVYVLDYANNRVQKFGKFGNFITKWGSYGSGDGQFDEPIVLAIDPDDNVYVLDQLNNRIQKFDSDGNFITKWGSAGSGDGQFAYPWGMAIDSDYNVYVADTYNERIQKFDSNGTFITKWGSLGSGDGEFIDPIGIAVDIESNIYVVDEGNSRIQKFDSGGNFITKWGSAGPGDGQFNRSRGITVDDEGNVYVVDTYNHRVQKFYLYNTPPGDDVVAEPVDPETGESPVTMTFDEVTDGGETTLTISDTGPPPTTGFKLGDPETFYEIETTASFSGNITICIDYSGVNVGNEDNLRFSHYESGTWVEVPILSHDKNNDIVCGQVASLSIFALFEPMALDDLIQLVQVSDIHSGIRKGLVKKLQNAQKSLDKGNISEALDQITGFQNEVRAQSGKKIPNELADEWIEISEIILDSL
ncbi:6-bladed beta-propeller [Acidobacteriota bacterium]